MTIETFRDVFIKAFARLSYRERDVLMRRETESLERIGVSMGISRQGAHKIEQTAIGRLDSYVESQVGKVKLSKQS